MTSRHDSNASSSSAGTTYAGSLQAKKKAELQEIAQALKISDGGTREDLQQRIKKHLDENTRDLEDDPTFSGLFTSRRRQKSVQPQQAPPSAVQLPNQTQRLQSFKPSSSRPSMGGIKEQRESTPMGNDLRDVSMMLPRAPLSPESPSPSPHSTPTGHRVTDDNAVDFGTPSSLPPLPPSPSKSIIADAMAQPEVQAVVEMERSVIRGSAQILSQTRAVSRYHSAGPFHNP